jgi:hypothetical protein
MNTPLDLEASAFSSLGSLAGTPGFATATIVSNARNSFARYYGNRG